MRWLLVAFLSGMAMLSGVAMATAADTFVYVSDSKDHAIKIFRMDEEGTLQPADVVKLDGAPGSLNPDPQNRFLFASIRSSHALFSFALDPASGKLKQLSSTKLDPGANAAYVGTDRTGKFLVSASYSGGKVVVHTISSEGKLSEEPVAAVQTEKTAHAAVFDRENQLLFVPNVAPNAVPFRPGSVVALGQRPGREGGRGPSASGRPPVRQIRLHVG
jgi:6-phosphogluconolactonase